MNTNLPTLDDLATELTEAKQRESAARTHRLEIEDAILKHPDLPALKEEGTSRAGRIKIVTGLTRKWDQAQLATIRDEVDPAYFPFKTELKEDRGASKVMAEAWPDLWALLSPALELKPKKPSISIEEPS